MAKGPMDIEPRDRDAIQTVQVHLRLPRPYAELLRKLAEERDQTQSAVIRALLRSCRDAQRVR